MKSYRQSFGDQRISESVWNNKNGWFKLAHVCHNWRSVVLASPSRLPLRLIFTHDTDTRALALESLLHLKIIVDYSNSIWDASTQKHLISALRYPVRVCRITFKGWGGRCHKYIYGFSEALSLPFPSLESLELQGGGVKHVVRILLAIQPLRHPRLDGSFHLPILSATISLVDLTLSVYSIFCLKPGVSLLTHLQHMPYLRNLQLSTHIKPCVELPPNPTTTVLLAKLTCLRFSFMAGLVAPSLRELHISTMDLSTITHIPHLSEFIWIAVIVFLAARLTVLRETLRTSLFAHPLSSDGLPSKITIKTLLPGCCSFCDACHPIGYLLHPFRS